MEFREWLRLSEMVRIAGREFRDKEALAALNHLYRTHPNPGNLVVTYTNVDKVGINPKTQYDTPMGIYFYPLYHVLDKGLRVEYAAGSPYIQVCEFTQPERIWHMRESDAEAPSADDDGVDILIGKYGAPLIERLIGHMSGQHMFSVRSNYSTFFYLVGLLAQTKLGIEEAAPLEPNPTFSHRHDKDWKRKTLAGITRWNSIFRGLGILGFLDHGTGTIFLSEDTQGVAFSKEALKVIHTIDNPIRIRRGAGDQYEQLKRAILKSEEKGLLFLQHTVLSARTFHDENQIKLMRTLVQPFKSTSIDAVVAAALKNKYLDDHQLAALLGVSKGMWFPQGTDSGGTLNLSLAQRVDMLAQDNVDKIANSRNIDKFTDSVIDKRDAAVSTIEFANAVLRRASSVTPQLRGLVTHAARLGSAEGKAARASEDLLRTVAARGDAELANAVRRDAQES